MDTNFGCIKTKNQTQTQNTVIANIIISAKFVHNEQDRHLRFFFYSHANMRSAKFGLKFYLMKRWTTAQTIEGIPNNDDADLF